MRPEVSQPFVPAKLRDSAKLYEDRNAVYGDNFRMVGKVMVSLFPNGMVLKTEEDHNKYHLFVLKIVKLTRYAVNYRQGHMDSLDDDIIYTAMIAALDNEAELDQASKELAAKVATFVSGSDKEPG